MKVERAAFFTKHHFDLERATDRYTNISFGFEHLATIFSKVTKASLHLQGGKTQFLLPMITSTFLRENQTFEKLVSAT
jgi:hypothetical protein